MDMHLWAAIIFTIINSTEIILLSITLFVPKLLDKIGSITFLIIIAFMALQTLISIGYLIYEIVA